MLVIKQHIVEFARLLRRISGDDAYERYVQHHHQYHRDQPLLDRRAFYLAEQQRKWSGIKRCC
ncbi:MAG: YbdD/YjiX family protein [Steroidobacter sp.]